MNKFHHFHRFVVTVLLSLGAFASIAYATHSWGGYHWARTANPFTLKLGDNVSLGWDSFLAATSADWSASSVLDTTVVTGQTNNPRRCRPTAGRVEVCDSTYGNNGWLGIAQIWVSGNHIVQGVTKMNDTYFNTAPYNTPAWKQFVVCQEIGHTFGLAHQDENFWNPNLGTCMDYTSDPGGTIYSQISNEHPNTHDYEELGIVYGHFDNVTTVGQILTNGRANNTDLNGPNNQEKDNDSIDNDSNEPSNWGKEIKKSPNGRSSLYERDLGRGHKIFTFVIWAD